MNYQGLPQINDHEPEPATVEQAILQGYNPYQHKNTGHVFFVRIEQWQEHEKQPEGVDGILPYIDRYDDEYYRYSPWEYKDECRTRLVTTYRTPTGRISAEDFRRYQRIEIKDIVPLKIAL